MGDPLGERTIFEVFLKAAPQFCGEPVAAWERPSQDPPDITCTTLSGRKVGVELVNWLDEGQIKEAKQQEAVQDSISEALDPQPDNTCEHIYYVWLHPNYRMRVDQADRGAFRSETLRLVEEVDSRWEQEEDWHSPQGCSWRDFGSYPTLSRYLNLIQFFPRDRYQEALPGGPVERCAFPAGQSWLTFPSRGGFYTPDSMSQALKGTLRKKIQRCDGRPAGLDELHLLVHYSQAWIYNSPVDAPGFGFSDAAAEASRFIGNDPGVFTKIFVFLAFGSADRVFQLFPLQS